MIIRENEPLSTHTSFGIEVNARYRVEIRNEADWSAFLEDTAFREMPRMVMGGGSNMLFTRDYDGVIIHNCISGIEVIKEDKEHVFIKIGAGESWHDTVMYCVNKGWGGIENLSLIPGKVGAAPIQNIGAYGVEIKDVFESLNALSMTTGNRKSFSAGDCNFGYRDSVFKQHEKGKWLITSVVIRLKKNPKINTKYGAITQELELAGVNNPTIRDISDAVIRIRQSKLPDPAKIGNGGSFFKNPVIHIDQFKDLLEKHPDIVSYPVDADHVKIPAGWLIDQAGWKGKTFGNFGVHKNQALVLVNYGGASGADIYQLSQDILDDIKSKYGIELEREVNVI